MSGLSTLVPRAWHAYWWLRILLDEIGQPVPGSYPMVPSPPKPASFRRPRRHSRVTSVRLAAFAAAGVLVLGLAGVLLLMFPIWGESASVGERLPVAGTVLAATILAVGAFIAWRQRQESQAAERYSAALALLDDSSLIRRTAGARALGALAAEVPAWQPDAVETLCNFVCYRSSTLHGERRHRLTRLMDVEAAMIELGRRNRAHDGHVRNLELSGVHAPELVLFRFFAPGANLRGAVLARAYLSGSVLRGALLVEVDFGRAKLDRVDLRGAHLFGTNFEDADLQGADLRKASLEFASFLRADLRGADLRGASTDTYTTFTSALFDDRTAFPSDFDPAREGMSRSDGDAVSSIGVS